VITMTTTTTTIKWHRRDYNAHSAIIKEMIDAQIFDTYTLKQLSSHLGRMYEKDNPQFDYVKFMSACGFTPLVLS
jgi:hypothetical protein